MRMAGRNAIVVILMINENTLFFHSSVGWAGIKAAHWWNLSLRQAKLSELWPITNYSRIQKAPNRPAALEQKDRFGFHLMSLRSEYKSKSKDLILFLFLSFCLLIDLMLQCHFILGLWNMRSVHFTPSYLLNIGSLVDGFLLRRCNKPNQTKLINPDLINRTMQIRAFPVALRKAGSEGTCGRYMGRF